MGKALELTGQKFGKLTVLKKTDIRKGSMVCWECQCDCGKIVIAAGSELKNGHKKSCGCLSAELTIKRNQENRKVQIGNRYGKLVVIEDLGLRKASGGKRRNYSLCQCDCGKQVEAMDNMLANGNKKSCGCLSSMGEYVVEEVLKLNSIIYTKNIIFPPLLEQTGRRLRFDFIIYNQDGSINRFVEFDGNQHKTGMWGGNWSHLETLEVIQERDVIKNNFCISNNFILVRLPYYTIGNMTLDKIMGNKFIIKELRKEN